jgi:hypothetical protein
MFLVVVTIVFVFGVIFSIILNTAAAAMEGAILAHLRLNHEHLPNVWMKTTELVYIFGTNVYPYLRKMEMSGLIEHRTYKQRPGEHRRGRDTSWYRLKTVEGEDPFFKKIRLDGPEE